jgi:predicted DNA binding CopG/RHH family protein
MTNHTVLDDEEQQILDAYEAGEFTDVADFVERKAVLEEYARNTLSKSRNINIRVSERDLYRLKAKAIEEGIPYQTLSSSILHKAVAR